MNRTRLAAPNAAVYGRMVPMYGRGTPFLRPWASLGRAVPVDTTAVGPLRRHCFRSTRTTSDSIAGRGSRHSNRSQAVPSPIRTSVSALVQCVAAAVTKYVRTEGVSGSDLGCSSESNTSSLLPKAKSNAVVRTHARTHAPRWRDGSCAVRDATQVIAVLLFAGVQLVHVGSHASCLSAFCTAAADSHAHPALLHSRVLLSEARPRSGPVP